MIDVSGLQASALCECAPTADGDQPPYLVARGVADGTRVNASCGHCQESILISTATIRDLDLWCDRGVCHWVSRTLKAEIHACDQSNLDVDTSAIRSLDLTSA